MEISVQDLNRLRTDAEDHTLLDIREHPELQLCAIEGAVHIPMNELPGRLTEMPQDHPLVVMCHIGGRSAQVTGWLRANGYENAVSLAGGISAWSAEIDPSVPTY